MGKTASHPLKLLASSVSIIVFVLSLVPYKGILVFSSPPASGDWIVTGTESYYDEVIVLNGNLFVLPGGNLTFRKVTLIMNCTHNGQYNISVDEGEFHVLDGSVITSANLDRRIGSFYAHGGSTFRMNNSSLFGSDQVTIMCTDAVVENSLISRNRGGIAISNDGVVVRNNNFSLNDDCGISVHFSSPTIYNNTITSNFGSGITIYWPESSPLIQDNTIAMNEHSGIGCDHNCSPIIQGNDIVRNGEGISCWNSSPIISGNLIAENLEAGISCSHYSNLTIVNNTITSNIGPGPGISCYDHSHVIIQGNTIKNTTQGDGIALNLHCTGIIQGNMITNNSMQGIGIVLHSNPLIQGNIITSNGDAGIHCADNSLPEVHWNDIYGNSIGIENDDSSVTIDAIYNYWGNGPSTSLHVLYNPWLTESIFPFALAIESPKSGTTVGLTLVVRVQTSALVDISRIEFYIQNVLTYTAYEMPYQWSWDTTQYPNGEYIISAKAYDSSGNMKTCKTTVTVENAESPWWQIHFWSIIQVLIGLGSLLLGLVAYLARKERKKSK